MSRKANSRAHVRNYGIFALAVVLFVLGVAAFSAWSYRRSQLLLLEHINQALIDTTYATEQIVGRLPIECAVQTGEAGCAGLEKSRLKLERLADACKFEATGIIVREGTNAWILVAGASHRGNIPPGSLHFRERPPPQMAAAIMEMARQGGNCSLILDIVHEEYGPLHVAVRYCALSPTNGYAVAVSQNIERYNTQMRSLALHTEAIGLFLVAMAFPLIFLYNQTLKKSTRQLGDLNARLQQDLARRKKREEQLRDAIHDLERFNAVALGREKRIIELKAEVNTLLEQMKRQKRYHSPCETHPSPDRPDGPSS